MDKLKTGSIGYLVNGLMISPNDNDLDYETAIESIKLDADADNIGEALLRKGEYVYTLCLIGNFTVDSDEGIDAKELVKDLAENFEKEKEIAVNNDEYYSTSSFSYVSRFNEIDVTYDFVVVEDIKNVVFGRNDLIIVEDRLFMNRNGDFIEIKNEEVKKHLKNIGDTA